MNIYDYAVKYKDCTFEEKPFNNVDAVIFASLSYCQFDKIAPSIKEPKNPPKYFRDITDDDVDAICSVKTFGKDNRNMVLLCRESLRYKDVAVQYIFAITDNSFLEQFFALTFNIPFVGYFVCFRGTDSTITGWKENFILAVQGATAAQLDSVEYLNIVKRYLGDTPFMVAGHSKGGNLAMYSSLYSSKDTNDLISKVYCFDGTGFYTKKFRELESYKRIYPKIVQIVPKNSIVGELFYTPDNHLIVEANASSKFAEHYLYRWVVTEEGDFKYIIKRSWRTKITHRAIKNWARKAKKNDKLIFINIFIEAFSGKNNEFQAFDKGTFREKRKRVKETLKTKNKSDRKCFRSVSFKLCINYVTSFFYYVFKPLFKLFKQNKKKEAN